MQNDSTYLVESKSFPKNTCEQVGLSTMMIHESYQFEYQNKAQIDLQEEKLMKARNKKLSIEPLPEVYPL